MQKQKYTEAVKMQVKTINSSEEVSQCFDAFLELRPHLNNKQSFTEQVLGQQKDGYQITAISENIFGNDEIVACIGFRFMTTLAWGKIIYIDDLITKEKCRGKGYGHALLDYSVDIARKHACNQIHLDTGYGRHAAHKVYLNHGFEFTYHHLALVLK